MTLPNDRQGESGAFSFSGPARCRFAAGAFLAAEI